MKWKVYLSTKTLKQKNKLPEELRFVLFLFTEDLSFIKELQDEFESLLHNTKSELIPADQAFKDLTDSYGRAGALLKGIRIREGLTQIEFARLIGTTQANLSSMEGGTRPIGKKKAKLLAEKFGVDYRYFL